MNFEEEFDVFSCLRPSFRTLNIFLNEYNEIIWRLFLDEFVKNKINLIDCHRLHST